MPRNHRTIRPPPKLQSLPMSDALRSLATRSEPRFYAKGRVLIDEGDVGGGLFIILSGRLRAYSSNEDDSRRVTYGEYLPGEFLGEMSLDGGTRSATVEAVEDSWCALVTRQTLEQHIAEHPTFAFELLSKVIRRARMATLSLRAVALNDVYGRVVWLLNERAAAQADGTRRTAPLTHQEMADLLGCTRPMVSRVMKELERGDYIATVHRCIVLKRALPARF